MLFRVELAYAPAFRSHWGNDLWLKLVSEGADNTSELIIKMRSVTVNRTTQSIHLDLQLKTHFCKNRGKTSVFLQPSFFSGKSDDLTELPLKNDGCKNREKTHFLWKKYNFYNHHFLVVNRDELSRVIRSTVTDRILMDELRSVVCTLWNKFES